MPQRLIRSLAVGHLVVAVGTLTAVTAIYLNVVKTIAHKWIKTEFASGPDAFCYLRQAQLFERNGLLGGLHTAIRSETEDYLMAKAKQLGFLRLPVSWWGGAVGPRCHNYNYATDSVVLQYPPGTGLFLSLFPEGLRVRGMYIAGATILLVFVAAQILVAQTVASMLLNAFLGGFIIYIIPIQSFSMVGTIVLCVLLAWSTVRAVAAESTTERNLFAAASGLMLGLSVCFRIPNLFLAIGYFAAAAVALLRCRHRSTLHSTLLFTTLLLAGLAPVFVANTINAGSPFATTYGGADAALPRFDWQMISTAARFYFSETRGLIPAAAIILTVLFEMARRWMRLKNGGYLSIIGAVNLLFGAAYYITHEVLIPYYFVATPILSIALIIFGVSQWNIVSRKSAWRLASVGTIAAGVGGALLIAILNRMPLFVPPPSISFENNAIVWADASAGSFLYYLGINAPALGGSVTEVQDRMIAEVAKDGRPQYFVDDDELMHRLVVRKSTELMLQPVRNAFDFKVYRHGPE